MHRKLEQPAIADLSKESGWYTVRLMGRSTINCIRFHIWVFSDVNNWKMYVPYFFSILFLFAPGAAGSWFSLSSFKKSSYSESIFKHLKCTAVSVTAKLVLILYVRFHLYKYLAMYFLEHMKWRSLGTWVIFPMPKCPLTAICPIAIGQDASNVLAPIFRAILGHTSSWNDIDSKLAWLCGNECFFDQL